MTRLIVVFALAIGVVAAAFGSAAMMTINGGSVQVGSDSPLQCQTGNIQVTSWGVNSSGDAVTGGKVTFVQISGVDDTNCQGDRLMGSIRDNAGNIIGYTTLIKVSSGAAETFEVPAVINGTQQAGYGDPHNGTGSYKLQLIDTASPVANYGLDASGIYGVTFWIEGAN